MDESRVIGLKGDLPWKLPEDMKHFAALTKGHAVLMGRTTYDSLPPKFKPLPGRKNIVISRSVTTLSGENEQGVELWKDIESCLAHYRSGKGALSTDTLWIIGGASIYEATMPFWDGIELTKVHGTHAGDRWFPKFEDKFQLVSSTKEERCTFERYEKKS